MSGLLVVGIGAGVLRARIRWARARRAGTASGHGRAPRPRCTVTDPAITTTTITVIHMTTATATRTTTPLTTTPRRDHTVTRRSLIGMGAAAGLIPCPSALVVLLGAIAQHEVALGLLLIVAFSLGLAGTLTALGLAVVYARRLLPRVRMLDGRMAAVLPAASALVIVIVGFVLTARAVPGVV